MASRRRSDHPHRCRRCQLERLDGETFHRGLCPACLELDQRKRHRDTGARILERAKDGGTIEREGQTFRVVQLPRKRRGGRPVR
jgi:hypothetical protein